MIVLQNTVRRAVAGLSFAPGGRLVAGGSGGFDVWNLATRTATHYKSHAEQFLFGCVADPLGRLNRNRDGDGSTAEISSVVAEDGKPWDCTVEMTAQRHSRNHRIV